jgi:hypothetical protein
LAEKEESKKSIKKHSAKMLASVNPQQKQISILEANIVVTLTRYQRGG